MFDCAFGVIKTLFICKDKYFAAAVSASLSVIFFVYAARQTGDYVYVTIFLATFLGNYLPPKLLRYLDKDKLFLYEVTSQDLETGMAFAQKLRGYNLQVNTNICFNSQQEKIATIRVYSKSKTTSKLIEDNIPADFNYNIITPLYSYGI